MSKTLTVQCLTSISGISLPGTAASPPNNKSQISYSSSIISLFLGRAVLWSISTSATTSSIGAPVECLLLFAVPPNLSCQFDPPCYPTIPVHVNGTKKKRGRYTALPHSLNLLELCSGGSSNVVASIKRFGVTPAYPHSPPQPVPPFNGMGVPPFTRVPRARPRRG
ncbi:hypothetical protein M408DRAFT_121565 [Serendipita vermifera MAFF 305830]|uniref:Uncharacterized protein n=1 Tax=Serendipita vermifera MAFF 305830 TaxID=933852 RepID=A0A0C3BAX6_SERVB|nr:hypothetical protein M408DRAFT_121565 [Serendipita vermifera MAFF 305830]